MTQFSPEYKIDHKKKEGKKNDHVEKSKHPSFPLNPRDGWQIINPGKLLVQNI